jgi:circadian clock protein KaiC
MPAKQPALTGIAGLDEILGGGLTRDRMYLLHGDPGVGKTTVGLQFLRAGVELGERSLYVALSETRSEIDEVARSHGWTLDGITVIELSALDQSASMDADNTLFEPTEVELQETTRLLLAHVERLKPQRVVFDSLSELRLLSQSALRYRRQILGLKQYFADKESTVLLLDDKTSEPNDQQLQSIAHGVIELEQVTPVYGEDRRRIRIGKLRGVKFRGGYHDFTISTGGVTVFPRIVPAEHVHGFKHEQIASGLVELDTQLGGGLDRGTATLMMGPAGSGKSSLAIQYAVAAAKRGEVAALFTFDERISTLLERTRALGCDLAPFIDNGSIVIRQIDPAQMGPGEFADCVRRAVVDQNARVVVIDSLNGYMHAMTEERLLSVQMHELLAYLGHKGVATILVMAQHGLFGSMKSPIDVSYLADTVVLLRYFEAAGRIRKAISIVKKRSGAHENTIRELTLDARGLHVGEALESFQGVLSGVPQFVGNVRELETR